MNKAIEIKPNGLMYQSSRVRELRRDSEKFASVVRAIVCETIGAPPNLDELSGMFCMSTRNFGRELSKAGTSYRDILREQRSKFAKEMLAQDRISIKELSSLMGFTDSSNFSKAFKSWVGSSPKCFRNQHSLSIAQ